jgi:hypothetical protein
MDKEIRSNLEFAMQQVCFLIAQPNLVDNPIYTVKHAIQYHAKVIAIAGDVAA